MSSNKKSKKISRWVPLIIFLTFAVVMCGIITTTINSAPPENPATLTPTVTIIAQVQSCIPGYQQMPLAGLIIERDNDLKAIVSYEDDQLVVTNIEGGKIIFPINNEVIGAQAYNIPLFIGTTVKGALEFDLVICQGKMFYNIPEYNSINPQG